MNKESLCCHESVSMVGVQPCRKAPRFVTEFHNFIARGTSNLTLWCKQEGTEQMHYQYVWMTLFQVRKAFSTFFKLASTVLLSTWGQHKQAISHHIHWHGKCSSKKLLTHTPCIVIWCIVNVNILKTAVWIKKRERIALVCEVPL